MNKKEFKKYYLEYLQSEQWLNIRLDILSIRKNCERCGSKRKLHVHHKTYKNFGHEEPQDLELLCEKCHQVEHRLIIPKNKRKRLTKKQLNIKKQMEYSRKQQLYAQKYY